MKAFKIFKAYTFVVQFILELLVALTLCYYIGIKLDNWLNTEPIFMFIMVVLGAFTPIVNLAKRSKYLGDKNEKQ